MVTEREVEGCLDLGREALVLFAEQIVNGQRSRHEMYERVLVEHDIILVLLDDAPESTHEKIHELLDRYDTLLAALRN